MIDENQILEKIKTRGYWQIEIRPSEYVEKRLSLKDCKEIVRKSQVQLRGWYYPDISQKVDEFFVGNNYAENMCDWEGHLEIWRMYQSGQFIQYVGLWEDGLPNTQNTFNNVDQNTIQTKTILDPRATIWTISEVFLFASRLANTRLFGNSLIISLRLNNTLNRIIKYANGLRYTHNQYKCKISSINIERTTSKEDLVKDHLELAAQCTMEIFERFNWHSDTIKPILVSDQQDLLNRRFYG